MLDPSLLAYPEKHGDWLFQLKSEITNHFETFSELDKLIGQLNHASMTKSLIAVSGMCSKVSELIKRKET